MNAKDSALFSSDKNTWETPQALFDALHGEFHFTLDAAANHKNHKLPRYFTEDDTALDKDWGGETVWCNPPYGNVATGVLTKKCAEEGMKPGTTVVLLLPARTDRKSFHTHIYGKAEIRFLPGRLCFELNGEPIRDAAGRPVGAPFPSMVVVFRGEGAKL